MKNMTRSLSDLFKNLEIDNQDIHQSILKLVRTCSAIEKVEKSDDESKNTWIQFVEFVVSTLYFGDQQHFYNLGWYIPPSERISSIFSFMTIFCTLIFVFYYSLS